MPINIDKYKEIIEELDSKNVRLIAVSKTKPIEDIIELQQLGQKDFGENYVQELVEKYEAIGNKVNWHFIGHLQSNKVKYIAPFVRMIHSVDSLKLLQEIDKQAKKNNRIIDCLLQVYIATEETKFGLDETEIATIINEVNNNKLPNISIKGFMAMASFTNDETLVRKEFQLLRNIAATSNIKHQTLNIICTGMSQDYKIAIDEGSNMVRIGSLLFGERKK